MYITYCCNQETLDVLDTTEYRLNATAGEYRPTYLIRVSYWEKVPGHEAKNEYCALSYVWKQSGEIVQLGDGEYDCIDNGKHCIVEGYDMDIHGFIANIKRFFFGTYDKKDQIIMMLNIQEKDEQYEVLFFPSVGSKATVKYVTYDKLLQQICKDFQIEYLWYDKICNDQSDKENKQREIKQMHRIYGNACYTLAIVPEVHVQCPDDLDTIHPFTDNSAEATVAAWNNIYLKFLWWKRSWTLEETMVSKRILLIEWMLDFANQRQQGRGSVNQALNQAHFRTSSNEHDKIFSLVNIFHDINGNNNLIRSTVKLLRISESGPTHYYQPHGLSPIQARPLSLTEDCEECIILPILFKCHRLSYKSVEEEPSLKVLSKHIHHYFLPVLKKCKNNINTSTITEEERYQDIGIYYLGSPIFGDLSLDDPDEILNLIFKKDAFHNKTKRFIIQ
ncbi:hypothetical protein BDA99DRAFT_535643 [Phascolomyces articulosus]|uniref:Heterokaryon incompatibility domain-containing protein n=1 Tax=Phascolomyces articulosus TaxID=60185 RepID=A0AAD5PG11_9FUNG|nr:hypothetical protein BDA99DRAFT_535643 [Phascolomyces articulosus]